MEIVINNKMIFVHLLSSPLVLQKYAQGEYSRVPRAQTRFSIENKFIRDTWQTRPNLLRISRYITDELISA